MSLFSINQLYGVSCQFSNQPVNFLAAAFFTYVFRLCQLQFPDTVRPGWGD